MTTYDDQATPLPGLEDSPANITPLIRSLRRTVAELNRAGVLEESHALELEAMHVLARSAEQKVARGRASTVANDIDLLLRIKAGIVGDETESTMDDQLRAAMEEFNASLDGAGSS